MGTARGPSRSRTESGGARRKGRWAAPAPSPVTHRPLPAGTNRQRRRHRPGGACGGPHSPGAFPATLPDRLPPARRRAPKQAGPAGRYPGGRRHPRALEIAQQGRREDPPARAAALPPPLPTPSAPRTFVREAAPPPFPGSPRHCACAAATLHHRPLPPVAPATPPALPGRFEYANEAVTERPIVGLRGGHVGRGRVLQRRAPTCPACLKSRRRARKRLSQREKVLGWWGCGCSA